MTTQTKDIAAFVEDIILYKGFNILTKEVQDSMREDLTSKIESLIKLAILNNMPTEKRDEFDSLIVRGEKDEVVQNFISENIPNLKEILTAEMLRFKSTYI